jgi:Ca2+-transporting ATPase
MISYHIGLATGSHGLAMTMAFSTLCLARLFHGFNCRGKKSIFALGVFSNKFSWIAFIVGVLLVNVVLLVPALQSLFEITPLSTDQLLNVHLFAFIPTLIIQIYRIIKDAIENKNEISKDKDEFKTKNKAA